MSPSGNFASGATSASALTADPAAIPQRVRARPDPAQWADDELLTLVEAAALLYPRGPLTARSLRTEAANGKLDAERIAGKLFVTPQAIREMRLRCRVQREVRASICASDTADSRSGSSSISGGVEVSTGCGPDALEGAEKHFEDISPESTTRASAPTNLMPFKPRMS